MVLRLFVMPTQQIVSEVVLRIPPHRVHVVGSTLHVVVLDQDSGAVDTVVVTLAALRAARPRKVQLLESGLVDSLHLGVGDVGVGIVKVFLDEVHQRVTLFIVHFRSGQPFEAIQFHRPRIPGDDVPGCFRLDDDGPELAWKRACRGDTIQNVASKEQERPFRGERYEDSWGAF